MRSILNLRRSYDEQRRRSAFHAAITIGDAGLILGRGSLLARNDPSARREFLDGDDERLMVLLAVAHGRKASPLVLHCARRAITRWRCGEAALAHIELAFAGLPRLAAEEDAFRLFVAETLLDDGLAPRDPVLLLTSNLAKYDPDQPRVPAGSGRESGRWGSTAASGNTAPLPAPDNRPAEALPVVARSFLVDASPSIVEALAVFASRFSVPTAVLGALFIPTPNSGGVTEGTLPGAPDVRFRRDGPEGTLRLARTEPDGSEAVVVAHSRGGITFDSTSGEPLGRDLGEQLYLDLATVEVVLAPRERPQPAADDDGPQLCPKPTVDTPHGASPRANAYEDDVHARVNPLAPLPPGFGVKDLDPATGRYVFFDDCFRYAGDLVDGDMHAGDLVEAKGPRRAYLYEHNDWSKAFDDDAAQAEKQLRVARRRGVGLKWYNAEEEAADMARKRFEREQIDGIVVSHMPPRR